MLCQIPGVCNDFNVNQNKLPAADTPSSPLPNSDGWLLPEELLEHEIVVIGHNHNL